MNYFPYDDKTTTRKSPDSFIFMIIAIILIFFSVGCGENVLESVADDDSFEAKLEDARMALDDREYVEAREILLALLEDDPESDIVRQYLSNSWSGSAGLDIINLLEIIDELDGAGESGDIEMFGKVLGDENGVILRDKVFDKVEKLNTSFLTMDEIQLLQNLNKDQTIQLGIIGVTHLAFVVTEIIMNDLPNLTQITMTDEGLDALYDEGSPPDFDEQEATDEALDAISRDLSAIGNAIDELNRRGKNDLAEDMEDFVSKIDPDGNEIVTRQELENYVDSL